MTTKTTLPPISNNNLAANFKTYNELNSTSNNYSIKNATISSSPLLLTP
jgi:hypothetical protein